MTHNRFIICILSDWKMMELSDIWNFLRKWFILSMAQIAKSFGKKEKPFFHLKERFFRKILQSLPERMHFLPCKIATSFNERLHDCFLKKEQAIFHWKKSQSYMVRSVHYLNVQLNRFIWKVKKGQALLLLFRQSKTFLIQAKNFCFNFKILITELFLLRFVVKWEPINRNS